MLTEGASIVDRCEKGEDLCLKLAKEGAGLDVTWLKDVEERYLTFRLEAKAEHSVPANILVYSKKEPGEAVFDVRFGALDAEPSSTGLEGVADQKERGVAYRYYCERVAAHPYGVGCHYFQCYDQFTLGRFDGENYNIGLFDICSHPYPEMISAVKECSSVIYEVASGKRKPVEQQAKETAMVAF